MVLYGLPKVRTPAALGSKKRYIYKTSDLYLTMLRWNQNFYSRFRGSVLIFKGSLRIGGGEV